MLWTENGPVQKGGTRLRASRAREQKICHIYLRRWCCRCRCRCRVFLPFEKCSKTSKYDRLHFSFLIKVVEAEKYSFDESMFFRTSAFLLRRREHDNPISAVGALLQGRASLVQKPRAEVKSRGTSFRNGPQIRIIYGKW